MTNTQQKVRQFFGKSFFLILLMSLIIPIGMIFLVNPTSPGEQVTPVLPGDPSNPGDGQLEANAPPDSYPTYTGSGSSRTAKETLWGNYYFDNSPWGIEAPYSFIVDLPGTTTWAGTRMDIVIDDIREQINWISNSDFTTTFNPWTEWNTGGDVDITRNADHGDPAPEYGTAVAYQFDSTIQQSDQPPLFSSTTSTNAGDAYYTNPGSHWSGTTNLGGGTPTAWNNGLVSGRNSFDNPNNRDGVWEFYVRDREDHTGPDAYTVTYTSTYTYTYNQFPVDDATFQFSYYYYSTDFDQGPACSGSYSSDYDRFTFKYQVFTQDDWTSKTTVVDWQAVGGTDPPNLNWQTIPAIDITDLFSSGTSGSNFRIEFEMIIYVDVDDGSSWVQECNHNTWCDYEYCCIDKNNEDNDYLYLWIDGLELSVDYTTTFGAGVNPYMQFQDASFNSRNVRDANLYFDIYVPSSFFVGVGDNNLYVDVEVNQGTVHRYTLNSFTKDDFVTKTIAWGAPDFLQLDFSPSPATLEVNIYVVLGVAGWYASGGRQSIWIDNVHLNITSQVPADVAQVYCYDDADHSNNQLTWGSTSEDLNTLTVTHTGTEMWQDDYEPSVFQVNCINPNAVIFFWSIDVTFYALPKYSSITPSFSIAADNDGWVPWVTWTMTHNVPAVFTSTGRITTWDYNLSIPFVPDYAATDWQVQSITDGNNDPVYWDEPGFDSDFKNISVYENDKTATAHGMWTINCRAPNKITSFNVTDQDGFVAYEYYPGGNNRSRIGVDTGALGMGSASIFVNYTDHEGNPVSGDYPDTSLAPGSSYNLPFWDIPTTAPPNDHYVAIAKWIDTASYNDEVGFAAHYVQVKRNVSVSSVQFLHTDSGFTSNLVVIGEQLRISVNVSDPLLPASSLWLDTANITIYYPKKSDHSIIESVELEMSKTDNEYYYLLQTDGGFPDAWLLGKAWMNGAGNRSFTITLIGNSTYLNGVNQNYQLSGWFHLVVDTRLHLPTDFLAIEQGLTFTLAVELFDDCEGHQPAASGISDSEKINNRTLGSPITDFDEDTFADTWNGSIFLFWNIIPENLTAWFANNSLNINNPNYQWNGTLEQKDGTKNRYETRIRVPWDSDDSGASGNYYFNITMAIPDNEWGWKFETQYMTLTDWAGPSGESYDDREGCFQLSVTLAQGDPTALTVLPFSSLGNPLTYYWSDPAVNMTRLYVRFYNVSDTAGFNSTYLDFVISQGGSWVVQSWVNDARVPASFGTDLSRRNWALVNSTTNLPDGTPDPRREILGDNATWGWFYSDFNWTEVNLGTGTFETGLDPAYFEVYMYAKIIYIADMKRAADASHYIKVDPNPVNLSITLRYLNTSTLLDANYYPGQMTTEYYWGDVLNFTLLAQDEVLNQPTETILLRYYIYEQAGPLAAWGNITERANGYYTTTFNTSDPSNSMAAGIYYLRFKGILGNRSITPGITLDPYIFDLKKRNTQLWPLTISGVFDIDSVDSYSKIDDIRAARLPRTFDPRFTVQTVPNEIINFSVYLIDATPRNYTSSNLITDANISWEFRNALGGQVRISGWSNTPDVNGTYTFSFNLSQMIPAFVSGEFGLSYDLRIIPYKPNYDSIDDDRYQQGNPGSTWPQPFVINKRPMAIIPLNWIYHYSQSNFKYHPIEFRVEDLITGENVTDCQIYWQIAELEGTRMEEDTDRPGHYYVVYDTWPSLFEWISAGQKYLEAQIIAGPPGGDYGTYTSENWDIARLTGNFKVSIFVESEGFLGPLTIYFWIILGCVGAVVGAFYSYKSYKFLTTPYVIRKIEESTDKISKDKKIAAGVMKSRDHLIFLEATELLKVVGVALKPPPAKKLPPPITKLAPKPKLEEIAKIPEIPEEIISAELDKAGVRPEEKPLLLQQIHELDPVDKKEFIEGLIGEERFKELVEDLKAKQSPKKADKGKKK